MIELQQITKSYGSGANRFPVLKGISLTIEDGDFAVILGASGSGKSTLLNILSGLERPDQGHVLYGTQDLKALSDQSLINIRRCRRLLT